MPSLLDLPHACFAHLFDVALPPDEAAAVMRDLVPLSAGAFAACTPHLWRRVWLRGDLAALQFVAALKSPRGAAYGAHVRSIYFETCTPVRSMDDAAIAAAAGVKKLTAFTVANRLADVVATMPQLRQMQWDSLRCQMTSALLVALAAATELADLYVDSAYGRSWLGGKAMQWSALPATLTQISVKHCALPNTLLVALLDANAHCLERLWLLRLGALPEAAGTHGHLLAGLAAQPAMPALRTASFRSIEACGVLVCPVGLSNLLRRAPDLSQLEIECAAVDVTHQDVLQALGEVQVERLESLCISNDFGKSTASGKLGLLRLLKRFRRLEQLELVDSEQYLNATPPLDARWVFASLRSPLVGRGLQSLCLGLWNCDIMHYSCIREACPGLVQWSQSVDARLISQGEVFQRMAVGFSGLLALRRVYIGLLVGMSEVCATAHVPGCAESEELASWTHLIGHLENVETCTSIGPLHFGCLATGLPSLELIDVIGPAELASDDPGHRALSPGLSASCFARTMLFDPETKLWVTSACHAEGGPFYTSPVSRGKAGAFLPGDAFVSLLPVPVMMAAQDAGADPPPGMPDGSTPAPAFVPLQCPIQ